MSSQLASAMDKDFLTQFETDFETDFQDFQGSSVNKAFPQNSACHGMYLHKHGESMASVADLFWLSYITISDWGRDSRQVQIAGQRSTWRGEFCGLQSCTHATEMSQSTFKCQVSHGIEFKHSYVELVTLSAMLSLES